MVFKIHAASLSFIIVSSACFLPSACGNAQKTTAAADALKPAVITEKVIFDTDDPAIWINAKATAQSLIIGTDKEAGGGLYAFDLNGKIVSKVLGLNRPNNVDIVYGFTLNGLAVDLAVTTERRSNTVRFFTVPGFEPVDGGGLPVFAGEAENGPMGVATYYAPDKSRQIIISRKSGPSGSYLWQYKLLEEKGKVVLQLVRKFGNFSGKKEIESIAVDNELGYVYYSDEQFGIRKYYADPSRGNEELAVFGQNEFKEDNEGISIYKFDDGTGYILVSDQGANRFNIYPREGTEGNAHLHRQIASLPFSTMESDGSETTSLSLPGFKGGLFVAMSTNKTFHYYRWADIAARAGLRINH
jgi:3-phytase